VLIVEDEALVAMDLALVLYALGCVVLRPAPRLDQLYGQEELRQALLRVLGR
jgi:hypothetical protein